MNNFKIWLENEESKEILHINPHATRYHYPQRNI